MRKTNRVPLSKYNILVLDDEIGVIDSLSVIFKRSGYRISGVTDPYEAIERLRNERFDLLILDFLMSPIHGDRVVELIREFDRDLYILLLTGYKDLAPPLKTIKTLDIQGYCEKSDRFDQLILLVESGLKSISQRQTIKKFKDGLNDILQSAPKIFRLEPVSAILEKILAELPPGVKEHDAFILADDLGPEKAASFRGLFCGTGRFRSERGGVTDMISPELLEKIGSARAACRSIVLDEGLVLPLISSDQGTIGVLYAETEDIAENRELLEIFVSLAAASLNNASLHSQVGAKNAELGRAYEMLKQRYLDVIETLRTVVETK
ncbi:MAG: DUF3369 domain-containing protein, partial [Clostridiales bacterium]|nr:DUF3369 domain-containing protein [Clostridiales bacterium]